MLRGARGGTHFYLDKVTPHLYTTVAGTDFVKLCTCEKNKKKRPAQSD